MAETWVFSGPNNTPTEAEKRLIAAAEAGEVADCSGLSKTERVVSASLLVAVASGVFKLSSRQKWSLHPDGVMLIRALVTDKVRATNRSFPSPLMFAKCRFSKGVTFSNATINGNIRFDRCLLAGGSDFSGAKIAGQFGANEARFLSPDGVAVFAQGVSATSWFMDDAQVYGAFDINGATFVGQFNANRARFHNPGDRAVFAQGVRASRWFMRRSQVFGSFEINGAVLAGQFNANGAKFLNRGGRAVRAQHVCAEGWFMDQAHVLGVFDINSAQISGQFNGSGSRFLGGNGLAISAEFSVFKGGVFLRSDTKCFGVINFSCASIGYQLDVADSNILSRRSGIAVDLSGTRITGELVMPAVFPRGVVDLSRAHASVLVDAARCWPKPLGRKCGDAGRLTREKEGQPQDVQHMVLDGFTYDHIEHPAGDPKLPASAVGQARLDWLCGQSARDLKQHFNPQPWKQCAKVLREMGYAKAAQEVLIEMRVRERHADGVSRRDMVVNWLLENLADYGFNPWRTVRISLYLIALFALAYLGGARACGGLNGWDSAARLACGGQPAFVQAKFNDFEEVVQKDDAGEPKRDRYNVLQLDKARPGYPDFSAFSYSLDAFTPVLDLGAEGFWHPNTKAWWTPKWLKGWKEGLAIPLGWLLYILTVVEAFLGSILTAIAISAFTGFLRPEEK